MRRKRVSPRRVFVIMSSMQPEVYYTHYELGTTDKTLNQLVSMGLILRIRQADGVIRYKRVFRRPMK